MQETGKERYEKKSRKCITKRKRRGGHLSRPQGQMRQQEGLTGLGGEEMTSQ